MGKFLKESVILITGGLAAIYLLNPTAGVLELIPDVVPIVGNMDEAVAVGLLINTAAYYGLDLGNLYQREERKRVVRRVKEPTADDPYEPPTSS